MSDAVLIVVAFLAAIAGTLVLVELIRYMGGNQRNGQPKS
jgi:hypothetical protein